MTLPAPTYDLVLLLDPQAEADARTKIIADSRTMIGEQGELVREDSWGDRALAYPIDKKTDAQYHLLQFHASTPELLSRLDRTLRIADEVVRFRIVKLKPGTPDAPDMSSGRRPEAEAPAPAAAPAAPAAAEPAAVEPAAAVADAPGADAPGAEADATTAAEPTPAESAPAAEPAPAEPATDPAAAVSEPA